MAPRETENETMKMNSLAPGLNSDSALQLEVTQPSKAGWAHVRVVPSPNIANSGNNTNGKLHLVLVVDVSGSMGSTVESTDADGKKENHGFSILDLVKHSLLTIVHSLTESQLVTLVTFSDNVTVELRDCVMTKAGVAEAEKAIKSLQPQCSTNLWCGLKKAYDIVKECTEKEAKQEEASSSCSSSSLFHEIMVFTDGMPNVEPPRGHIPAMQHYLAANEIPLHNHALRTYGFGYSLDSKLLQDIAVLGRGTFSFIPDAGFVGTVFIHALADMLTALCGRVRNARLQMACEDSNNHVVNEVVGLDSHRQLGMRRTVVMAGKNEKEKVEVLEIFVGGIGSAQPRDFIIRNPDFSRVFRLVYDEWRNIDDQIQTAGAGPAELPLAVTDDNLSAFHCDFDESMSMVSDFVSFNLRNQVGGAKEVETEAKEVPATGTSTTNQSGGVSSVKHKAWTPMVLDAKDRVVSGTSKQIAEKAKPHLCRLQMCDIISHVLDGDLKYPKAAATDEARRGSFFSRQIKDESGVTLEQKQKLVAKFIQQCCSTNKLNKLASSGSPGGFSPSSRAAAKDKASDASSEFDLVDAETVVSGMPLLSVAEEPDVEPAGASATATNSSSPSPAPSTTDRLTSSLLEGCLEDLKGQVSEAVSTEAFYKKWGVFYLRSLAMAHQTQKRNNFKDFGVQWYGAGEFDRQVDRINDVFDQLPPPEPSNKNRYGGGHYAAPRSMAVYNNCYGGCFLPECLVSMAEKDTVKRCDQIRAGDLVRTGNGGSVAKVLCVVKIVGSNMMCVKFHDSNLAITPWHPMLVKRESGLSEWVFPAEEAEKLAPNASSKVKTDLVYNFVLESAEGTRNSTRSYSELLQSTDALQDHTMVINGVPAVTFGHGLRTNSVVTHEFWGNMRAILRDMHTMRGFSDGQVLLRSETACVKDPTSNLVVKLVQRGVHVGCDSDSEGHELTDGDAPRASPRAPPTPLLLCSSASVGLPAFSVVGGCQESICG